MWRATWRNLCRFWSSRSGAAPESPPFHQTHRGCGTDGAEGQAVEEEELKVPKRNVTSIPLPCRTQRLRLVRAGSCCFYPSSISFPSSSPVPPSFHSPLFCQLYFNDLKGYLPEHLLLESFLVTSSSVGGMNIYWWNKHLRTRGIANSWRHTSSAFFFLFLQALHSVHIDEAGLE